LSIDNLIVISLEYFEAQIQVWHLLQGKRQIIVQGYSYEKL